MLQERRQCSWCPLEALVTEKASAERRGCLLLASHSLLVLRTALLIWMSLKAL